MIAALKGVVAEIGTDDAVIDVRGVGYLVQASARTLGALAPGETAHLLIETQVRESAITLFGFLDGLERDWFRLLTNVQGVGGKVGLAILGALTPQELSQAIALEDKAMLTRAPGVGPRLATRLVTELKGKIGHLAGSAVGLAGIGAPAGSAPAARALQVEAISALLNLGFREAEAARAVAEALKDKGGEEELPLGDLIREALKRAAR